MEAGEGREAEVMCSGNGVPVALMKAGRASTSGGRGPESGFRAYRRDILEVAFVCCGLGGAVEDSITEGLRLVSTQGRELGVSSVEPGQVAAK